MILLPHINSVVRLIMASHCNHYCIIRKTVFFQAALFLFVVKTTVIAQELNVINKIKLGCLKFSISCYNYVLSY